MKRIVIFLLLFLSLSSYSQSFELPPLRMGGDKILHFTASYVIMYNSYHYLETKMPKKKAKIYSILITAGAGIAKEIVDDKWRKGAENGDLIADGLGISFALITIDF